MLRVELSENCALEVCVGVEVGVCDGVGILALLKVWFSNVPGLLEIVGLSNSELGVFVELGVVAVGVRDRIEVCEWLVVLV